MRKLLAIGITVAGAALLLPLVVLAATQPELLSVYQTTLGAILDAQRDMFCASGIGAFCP